MTKLSHLAFVKPIGVPVQSIKLIMLKKATYHFGSRLQSCGKKTTPTSRQTDEPWLCCESSNCFTPTRVSKGSVWQKRYWSVFLPASNMLLQSSVDTPPLPHCTTPPPYYRQIICELHWQTKIFLVSVSFRSQGQIKSENIIWKIRKPLLQTCVIYYAHCSNIRNHIYTDNTY